MKGQQMRNGPKCHTFLVHIMTDPTSCNLFSLTLKNKDSWFQWEVCPGHSRWSLDGLRSFLRSKQSRWRSSLAGTVAPVLVQAGHLSRLT